MAVEENKMIIRRVFEQAFNAGNLALVDEVFAGDFIDHSTPDQLSGPQGVRDYFAAVRAGFPDMRVIIDDMIAEGEKVVIRTTWRGTSRRTCEGITPPDRTGRQVTRTMIQIFRITNGRIVEEWNEGGSLSS